MLYIRARVIKTVMLNTSDTLYRARDCGCVQIDKKVTMAQKLTLEKLDV